MKFLVLGILSALVIAGCVSSDPVSTAAVDVPTGAVAGSLGVWHDAAGALVAATPDLVRALGGQYWIGVAASEPTLGITSEGSVYMTGSIPNPSCGIAGGCPVVPYANFNKGPTVMKSSDKGQTWTDVFPKLPTGDSYKLRSWDPYVYVDRMTDRVFMDDIYPLGCGFLSFTDDGGDSWTHNPVACGNPHVNDHQTIGTAKPRVLSTVGGYPNLVYRCVNNVAYTACAISLNGGLTFLPQIPVLAAVDPCGGITGHLESDSEGRVFLPLCRGANPAVAITEDDGRTWKVVTISEDVPLEALHVDMAVDEADNVYAFWQSDGLPWFASSVDHGATWSAPIMVAAPGVTAIKFNAIAGGAAGKVAFAYVGTTLPGGYENDPSVCSPVPAIPCTEPDAWKNATWNAYIGIMEDALAAQPVIQSVSANDPADPIARGACGGRCSGMTDFIDIAIDAEGRPWASFVDVCVAECVSDPTALPDGNLGFAATLRSGPALRTDARSLSPLAPPPVPATA